MSEHPVHWHDVAALDALDPDFPTGVEVNGQAIGLFVADGQVHALENVCPHAYALLSQGFQEEGIIECPLHGARFEIATGKCLLEIGQRDLKSFAVKIEHGRVCVQA
jgi:nitrite reductase/ring-hydroxylating ferredoxin subunit